jgi:hypothetical protein
MMDQNLFFEVFPKTWNDVKSVFQRLDNFLFRGQANNSWSMKTSLERAGDQFRCPPEQIWDKEQTIFNNFKARAHQYIQSPPGKEEYVEWLALMQHYGCPTRLLDFTLSPYVASFFAMESAEADACIWAINKIHLDRATNERLKDFNFTAGGRTDAERVEEIVRFSEGFIRSPRDIRLVVGVTPGRLNDRISIQKGTFLMPLDIKDCFENNLCGTFRFPFGSLTSQFATRIDKISHMGVELIEKAEVIKINLPRAIHCDALIDLYKMNIDAASLFPGLEGFARSLRIELREMEKSYWHHAGLSH